MTIDPFAYATAMLDALAQKRVSSVELAALHIERIEELDGPINAVVVRDFERAREAACRADQDRAAGEEGALLGLPMTVKDGYYVEGLPATGGGIPERASEIADWDAPAVRAIKSAGGIIIGKTNMPPYAADHQSTNPLYGTTSNPWDLSRTPGGSSGGSAAALAAGMTPLEIGGDLAGSIRIPASFCGVYGHKSSETVGPRTGHFPSGKLPNIAFAMAVQGPMARSAADLTLLFDLLIGPTVGEDVAWRLELPATRHERLSDFRVAILPSFHWLPLDDEIAATLRSWSGKLSDVGATVSIVDPFQGDLPGFSETYLRILFSYSSAEMSRETAEEEARQFRAGGDRFMRAAADGLIGRAGDVIAWFAQRETYREQLRAFFKDWDILLAPCAMTMAFPHTAWPENGPRTLEVNGQAVATLNVFHYSGLCNLSGHPGTAFPAGLSKDGLPVGLQAIGPYLEDRTALRFAELVEEEFGGFVPPPDYRS